MALTRKEKAYIEETCSKYDDEVQTATEPLGRLLYKMIQAGDFLAVVGLGATLGNMMDAAIADINANRARKEKRVSVH